jgi:regulator of PEP synthase PpsR (kinase-PPPase family)
MGLAPDASYAAVDRIEEELDHAKVVMAKLNCPVIDVSNKAIEETANRIIELITENREA